MSGQEAIRKFLQQYAQVDPAEIEELHKKMGSSDFFLLPIPPGEEWKRNVNVILQIGMFIILNKPLYVIAPDAQAVPPHLRKLVVDVEYYDLTKENSVKLAIKTLLTRNAFRAFPA